MKHLLLLSFDPSATAYGVRVVATLAEQAGWRATILHLPPREAALKEIGVGRIIDACRAEEPDLIGMSLMHSNWTQAKLLTPAFNAAMPNVPVLWGGVLPTTEPEVAVKHTDYVCFGEADETLPGFLKWLENGAVGKVPGGFLARDGRPTEKNPPFPREIDAAPRYDWSQERTFVDGRLQTFNDGVIRRAFPALIEEWTTVASRLCFATCAFCSVPTAGGTRDGKLYRRRTARTVIDELMLRRDTAPRPNRVIFMDSDLFAMPRSWIEELASLYEEEIGIPFGAYASPASLDGRKLERFTKAGLAYLSIGIQSTSERVLKEIYTRNVSLRSPADCASIITPNLPRLRTVVFDQIVDSPWETDEELRQRIRDFNALPRFFTFSVFGLVLFKGTPLYDRAAREGILEGRKHVAYQERYNYRPRGLNRLLRLLPELPQPVVTFWLWMLERPGGELAFKVFYGFWVLVVHRLLPDSDRMIHEEPVVHLPETAVAGS